MRRVATNGSVLSSSGIEAGRSCGGFTERMFLLMICLSTTTMTKFRARSKTRASRYLCYTIPFYLSWPRGGHYLTDPEPGVRSIKLLSPLPNRPVQSRKP